MNLLLQAKDKSAEHLEPSTAQAASQVRCFHRVLVCLICFQYEAICFEQLPSQKDCELLIQLELKQQELAAAQAALQVRMKL